MHLRTRCRRVPGLSLLDPRHQAGGGVQQPSSDGPYPNKAGHDHSLPLGFKCSWQHMQEPQGIADTLPPERDQVRFEPTSFPDGEGV
jgi:hypothetical protein